MSASTLYRTLLDSFIAFKSISTDPAHKGDMEACASWLGGEFAKRGFSVGVVEGYGNPIVVARYEAGCAETCLVYGHYDVQPAQPDGWHGDPFAVTEKDGRLYARGAIDNKGQVLVHIATIFELIEQGALAYNVVCMIEGDEETGSPDLPRFIEEHAHLLASDFALISDGEIVSDEQVLELGFRGGFNAEVTVRTSDKDLHSGLFGGAVPNAGWVLSRYISNLHDENNRVSIAGFYEDVAPVSQETKDAMKRIPFEYESYKTISGTGALLTHDEHDFHTQVGLQPNIDVTGVSVGYTGEGFRNAVPGTATAKINVRLTAEQDPHKEAERFIEYTKSAMPPYALADIDVSFPYTGIKLDLNNKYIQHAQAMFAKVCGKEPLQKYSGGGLPIVTHYNDTLGIPQVLAPLANEDCNMHGVNENFSLAQLERALLFSEAFFRV